MSAIEVEELVVSYGSFDAVRGLSFQVAAGEVVALLGPNGAGKTTAVETIEGFRRPRAGRVRVLGLDPHAEHRELVDRLGVLLQTPGLYPMMTPARMLRLFASYYASARDPDLLLGRLGLDQVAHTKTKHLSGGERQRLGLALALVGRPVVAILDEPTSGVDPRGRLAVREVVDELRGEGVAMLLTTHELGEAERLADRVVIIDAGKLIAAGRPAELARAQVEFRFNGVAGIELGELSALLQASILEERPGEYRVAAAATPATIAALTGWLASRDLALDNLRTASLEDLYLSFVHENNEDLSIPGTPSRSTRGRALGRARRPARQ